MRFAVVMTTYEGAAFVRRQLESISAQTRRPSALLVCDDASGDGTAAIVEEFARSAAFPVHVVVRPERVGLQRNADDALAQGLELGDVIVLADQDDLWHPEKLETLAGEFEADPTTAMWFSDADLIGPDDRPLGSRLWQMVHLDPEWVREVEEGGGTRRLLHGQTITGPCMAIRADVVRRALTLPQDRWGGEPLFQPDGWLAVIARLSGRVVASARTLTLYRRHPGQLSAVDAGATADSGGRGPRRDVLELDSARVRLVADRLRDRPDESWDARLRAEVLALDDFLRVRTAAGGLGERLRGIRAQVAAGGYHRFARGTRTIAADLVRAVVPPR
jgi:glycosyltransferase involved in cell wall biosynthesis